MGSGILKPEVGKLQAIQQLPVPKTKHDVKAFLRIIGITASLFQTNMLL